MTLQLEKEIERKFCETIHDKSGFTVKFGDPTTKGAPDRIVFEKFGPHEETVFFVEFKKPQGVLAQHQIEYAKKLESQGILVFLIDSNEKVKNFFEKKHLRPTYLLLNAIQT